MGLLVALLLAADGGSPSHLYTVATPQPHGLLTLELRPGGRCTFKQVVSIHLPPAEVEVLDATFTEKGDELCLAPKPKALDQACLRRTDKGLEAAFGGKKVVLEKR